MHNYGEASENGIDRSQPLLPSMSDENKEKKSMIAAMEDVDQLICFSVWGTTYNSKVSGSVKHGTKANESKPSH